MAAVTMAQVQARKELIMSGGNRASVRVVVPQTLDDAQVWYYIKDPDAGAAVDTANAQGTALNGWKAFTYVNAGTAYGL